MILGCSSCSTTRRYVRACQCARVCACAHVRACVCVRACVRACMRVYERKYNAINVTQLT